MSIKQNFYLKNMQKGKFLLKQLIPYSLVSLKNIDFMTKLTYFN